MPLGHSSWPAVEEGTKGCPGCKRWHQLGGSFQGQPALGYTVDLTRVQTTIADSCRNARAQPLAWNASKTLTNCGQQVPVLVTKPFSQEQAPLRQGLVQCQSTEVAGVEPHRAGLPLSTGWAFHPSCTARSWVELRQLLLKPSSLQDSSLHQQPKPAPKGAAVLAARAEASKNSTVWLKLLSFPLARSRAAESALGPAAASDLSLELQPAVKIWAEVWKHRNLFTGSKLYVQSSV